MVAGPVPDAVTVPIVTLIIAMFKLGGASNITAAIRRHIGDATRALTTAAGPFAVSLQAPGDCVGL